ncbi:hypothetical protein DDE18_03765 [Nocardioides gansuensis]|uniref:Periplasmic binding protein domain-containing protein n=1 Tax=Nocardioides gansuensis TaxID=2138300 RepID=A0A2T8FG96_9ACTN|nr:hypothetical protein [Nocardioides gansuensis]PVG84725.1 hypothetical protein DDE18_03765 [Nocardioides gansuensis]
MRRRLSALALIAAALPTSLAGCRYDDPVLVAFVAADAEDTHAQPADIEAFEQRVGQRCDGCAVEVYDASGDADTQARLVDQALAAGAAVLVLEPVDVEAAEELTTRAGEVPVVAFGELVPGADRFVGLDSAPPDGSSDTDAGDDVEAARDVVSGKSRSMVFVPARAMSEQAADVAVGLASQTPVDGATEHEGVPAWLFESEVVTRDELAEVLVKEGVVDLDALCSGETARRCADLGLR